MMESINTGFILDYNTNYELGLAKRSTMCIRLHTATYLCIMMRIISNKYIIIYDIYTALFVHIIVE